MRADGAAEPGAARAALPPARRSEIRRGWRRCSSASASADSPTLWPSGLPLGMRQRLSLAVAVIHAPEMLILDEPTSGVDPVARDRFWELLIELSRREGVTIFISTHFMNEAARCDRISLMHAGKVLAQDTPAALMRAPWRHDAGGGLHCTISRKPRRRSRSRPMPSATTRLAPATVSARRTPARARARRFDVGRAWAYARREANGDAPRSDSAVPSRCSGRILLMIVFGYGISFDVDQSVLRRARSGSDAGEPRLPGEFRGLAHTSRNRRGSGTTQRSRRVCAAAAEGGDRDPAGVRQGPGARTPSGGGRLVGRRHAVPRRDQRAATSKASTGRTWPSSIGDHRRAPPAAARRSVSKRGSATTRTSRASSRWCRESSCSS